MPQVLPAGLNEFVELVIPELQRRGLFRTKYEGRTLRENVGLPRPANRLCRGPSRRSNERAVILEDAADPQAPPLLLQQVHRWRLTSRYGNGRTRD